MKKQHLGYTLTIILITLFWFGSARAQQPASRREAWRQDFHVVLSDFLPKDKSFSVASRAAFVARIGMLRDSIPVLTDEQLMTRLAAAIATSDNAHTRLYLVRNRSEVRRYPIRLWRFADGWRVIRARNDYADLLGMAVTHVAGQPIASVVALLDPLYAGTTGWKRYMATYTLTSPELLRGIGLAVPATGEVTVRGTDAADNVIERTISPMPLNRGTFVTESWWDLSPLHPGRDGEWRSALAGVDLPVYLQHPQRHYWMQADGRNGLLYVQYNRAQDEAGQVTVREFGAAVLDTISQMKPARIVIDLRFNTGGNLQLGDAFFRALAALPMAHQRGRLFVITSGNTFSAGMTPAAVLRQLTPAIFVGEDVGDDLDFWAEGGNVLLPNSKLTVHYANGFHGYSKRAYPQHEPFYYDLNIDSLTPHVPVALSWKDYRQGRDAALAAILTYGLK